MDKHNPAQKQLELNSLIEFSQLISSKLDLKYILNNILLSIMGKMLISKGMILLRETDDPDEFVIEAAKGTSAQISEAVKIIFPKVPVFKSHEMEVSNVITSKLGMEYFFKIYFQNKFLGMLCLGKKMNDSDLGKNEIIFIETMLNISASAIENTIKFNEVSRLNQNLNNKIQQLKSLFELSKEFNSNFVNKQSILKLLSYSLLGNFGIKDFAIISRNQEGNFYLLWDNKNLDISQFDPEKIYPKGKTSADYKKPMKVEPDNKDEFMNYLYKKNFELVIPAVIKNEVDNVICLGKKLNKSPYTDADIEFLQSIVNLSFISVQNSILFQEYIDKQKIEDELKIAREIQLALLPNQIPEVKGYELSGINIPALQVGGDYYDLIKLTDHQTAIVIADVSGKGTPASLLMANIQSAVHSYLKLFGKDTFDIAKVTENINELIFENTSPEKFITFFWGILDSEKDHFEFINAGHNPPVMLKKDKFVYLSEGGFMIGILNQDINYEVGRIGIERGDIVVLYTDGVTEAMNKSGEEFGEKRLTTILEENRNRSSEEILVSIKNSLADFTKGTSQYDDITLIVLKKK